MNTSPKFFLFTFIFCWLNLTLTGQVPNDVCETAIELSCGSEVEGTFLGANEENGTIQCGGYYSNYAGVWYRFSGTGDLIEMRLNHPSLAFGVDVFTGSCSGLECVPMLNTYEAGHPITVLTEEGLDYYFHFKFSFGNVEHPFNLQLICHPGEGNYACSTAKPLLLNESQTGNPAISTPFYNDCFSPNVQGHWYSITGTGNILLIDLENVKSIGLFKGSCEGLECVLNQNIESTYQHAFLSELGAEYYLLVGQWYNYNIQDYRITVSEVVIPPNTECSNALLLECNSDINLEIIQNEFTQWFQINGEGSGIKLKASGIRNIMYVNFFEENCSNTEPLFNRYLNNNGGGIDSISFFAESNKIYYIQFGSFENERVNLSVSCFQPPLNDVCAGALPISCGITYSAKIGNDVTFDGIPCGAEALGVWYKFEGDNKIHSFRITETELPFAFATAYFFSGHCGDLVCLNGLSAPYGPSSYEFFAKSGSVYYILIALNTPRPSNQISKISFRMDCLNPAFNDGCIRAHSTFLGGVYSGDLRLASPDKATDCREETSGLWYKIVGNGSIIQINNFGLRSFRSTIYTGSCNNLTCVTTLDISETGFGRFKSEVGVLYFIFIDQATGPVSFFLSGYQAARNDECEKAQELICGTTYEGNFENATYNHTSDQYCAYYQVSTLWYKFKGEGKYIQTQLVEGIGDISFSISTNGCPAGPTQCLLNGSFSNAYPVVFYGEPNTEYHISLFTSSATIGSSGFKFSFSCYEPAVNDECVNAILIDCGTRIVGDGIYANQGNYACYPEREGIWYKIIGTGQVITVQTTSAALGVSSGECQNLDCRVGQSQPSTSARFYSDPGETYYITVFQDFLSSFTLEVECEDPVSNDHYSSPKELACSDTINLDSLKYATEDYSTCGVRTGLWHKIKGHSEMVELHFISGTYQTVDLEIFADSVRPVSCINSINLSTDTCCNKFIFFAEDNKEYFFLISLPYSDIPEDLQLLVQCRAPDASEICNRATEIFCGDNVTSHLNQRGSREWIACEDGFLPGVWYKFEGNDQVVDFRAIEQGHFVYISVYEGTCSSLKCLISNQSLSSYFNFLAQKGFNYYIRISAEIYSSSLDFNFSVTCSDPPAGDPCNGAIEIQCGDQLSIPSFEYHTEYHVDCNQYKSDKSIWYKFIAEPNQSEARLSIVGEVFYSHKVCIFEGSCAGPSVIKVDDTTPNIPISFRTTPGQTYMILITSNGYQPSLINIYQLECVDLFISPCDESRILSDLNLPNESYPNGILQTNQRLEVGNTLLGPEAFYIWKAGESVEFQPGFEVMENAFLEIRMEPCDPVNPTSNMHKLKTGK